MRNADITATVRHCLRHASRLLAAVACIVAMAPCGAGERAHSSFPTHASQGALVIARVPPRSDVEYDGRKLRVAPDGSVVFGIGRNEEGPLKISVRAPHEPATTRTISIDPRDWPVEVVNGVPQKTIEPPPDVIARIKREAVLVAAARTGDDARTDFEETFIWPVEGRISGRFGNQRIYNGKPGAPHSGMDIAVPQGTPVKAPASGVVTFANADLYLTGGTVLIDHGHGVNSNFLHLSRIDVKVGDHVKQGQVIGAVGKTGRATGPHLHWGLTWFSVRLDPLLLPGIRD
jgi:biotin carboxyl carrier protein